MIYPWQQDTWQSLIPLMKQGRLPHAFLFSGLQGIGKLALVESFAQRLLCSTQASDQACGTCHDCRLFLTRAHPDALWLEPEKAGAAIKIDHIRLITDFVNQSSFQGKYRTIIIHPADKMNMNAANALLKTLEEPASGTVIFLITHQPGQLPATILSRCYKKALPIPNQTTALAWLKNQSRQKRAALIGLLKLAYGAPLRALQLTQDDSLALRNELVSTLIALKQQKTDPIKAAGALQETDLLFFIDVALGFVQDILTLQLGGTAIINDDLQTEITLLSQQGHVQQHLKWMDKLQWARGKLCQGINFNKLLMMEDLLISF